MIYLQEALSKDYNEIPNFALFLLIVCLLMALVAILYKAFLHLEFFYVNYIKKKLFYTHFYFLPNKLSAEGRAILKKHSPFYNRLSIKQKKYFEYRMSYFLKAWKFKAKNDALTITQKILVVNVATKLTFGFRDYKIGSINKIIIYPTAYVSKITQQMHKGEFNPSYKAIIFSWEDFLKGIKTPNDNSNLAVHEFIHALHFYFLQTRHSSSSAAIFIDAYIELKQELDKNETLKKNLIHSHYLRDYAYENEYEFLAVLVENFIETPEIFKEKFPELYQKVKEMLCFNFSGY